MLKEVPKDVDFFSGRPLGELIPEQVGLFTKDSLMAVQTLPFDPHTTQELLNQRDGQMAIAIDIGGSGLTIDRYICEGGQSFSMTEKPQIILSDAGKAYLDHLQNIASLLVSKPMPIGISCTGRVEKDQLVWTNNVRELQKDMKTYYGGKFSNLFPGVVFANDAVMAMHVGVRESLKRFPKTKNVIVFINGSGIGASVWTNDQIWATEHSKIEIVDKLKIEIGLENQANLSVRSVAAGKAGIEERWFQETGERANGEKISESLQQGDERALRLYDDSARFSALDMLGLMHAFDLDTNPGNTTIVCYGGIFQVPGYAERIDAYLTKYLGFSPQILLAKYENNICLEGAAIAALTAD